MDLIFLYIMKIYRGFMRFNIYISSPSLFNHNSPILMCSSRSSNMLKPIKTPSIFNCEIQQKNAIISLCNNLRKGDEANFSSVRLFSTTSYCSKFFLIAANQLG